MFQSFQGILKMKVGRNVFYWFDSESWFSVIKESKYALFEVYNIFS